MKEKSKKKTKVKTSTSSIENVTIVKAQPRRRVEPDAWYQAQFKEAAIKESKKYPDSEYMQLDFVLAEHEDNVCEDEVTSAAGMMINGLFSMPVTPKRTSFKVLSGMVGHTLEPDESVNLKSMYGNVFRVFIADTDRLDEDGEPWQTITLVKPIKKKVSKKGKKGKKSKKASK